MTISDEQDAAATEPVDAVEGGQEAALETSSVPESPQDQVVAGEAGLSSGDSGIRGRPEHSAEIAEKQEKTVKMRAPEATAKAAPGGANKPPKTTAKPKPSTAASRLDQRIRDIEHLLTEKESYQMAFVFERFPKPYYNQWKEEANEILALLVALKHRRRAMNRKAG